MIWGLLVSAWNVVKLIPAQMRTWLAVGAAAVVALVYAYGRGRQEQRATERQRGLERELEIRRNAEEVREDVAGSSDADVARRLRDFTQPR